MTRSPRQHGGLRLVQLACIALAGLAPASCAPGPEAAPPDTSVENGPAAPLAGADCLIVLLDALHSDHLGCYGGDERTSPNLDALAADGVRFARAWSVASWTLPSTASLFTGLFQETHGLFFGAGREAIRLADEAVTLAERFEAAGYDTCAYSENVFASGHYGLDQGFEAFHDVRWAVGDMTGDVAARLRAPRERPRFTYVHYRRPHSPFDPAPEHAALFGDPAYAGPARGKDDDIQRHNDGRRRLGPEDLAHHRALYEANIRHVDANLGRLLQAADRQRTLVVVLSDHGEAFGQHGLLGHNWQSFEEYVHIPLVMAHPALPSGRVVQAPVMSVDLVPTLTALFGLDPTVAATQGLSLAGLLAGGPAPQRPAVLTSSREDARGRRQLAAFDGRYKLLRRLPSGRASLFDLAADPAEKHDLLAARPDDARRLSRLLDAWQQGQRPLFVAPADGDLSPEQLQALQAMGYFGK